MTKNIGSLDRGIRIIAGLVLGGMAITGAVSGVGAIILGVFAVVFLGTSFISFCPLYYIFGLSTAKKQYL